MDSLPTLPARLSVCLLASLALIPLAGCAKLAAIKQQAERVDNAMQRFLSHWTTQGDHV